MLISNSSLPLNENLSFLRSPFVNTPNESAPATPTGANGAKEVLSHIMKPGDVTASKNHVWSGMKRLVFSFKVFSATLGISERVRCGSSISDEKKQRFTENVGIS